MVLGELVSLRSRGRQRNSHNSGRKIGNCRAPHSTLGYSASPFRGLPHRAPIPIVRSLEVSMSELAAHSHSHSHDAAPTGPEGLVQITTLAASKVNEIRQAEGIEGSQFLRLRVVGGGCAG